MNICGLINFHWRINSSPSNPEHTAQPQPGQHWLAHVARQLWFSESQSQLYRVHSMGKQINAEKSIIFFSSFHFSHFDPLDPDFFHTLLLLSSGLCCLLVWSNYQNNFNLQHGLISSCPIGSIIKFGPEILVNSNQIYLPQLAWHECFCYVNGIHNGIKGSKHLSSFKPTQPFSVQVLVNEKWECRFHLEAVIKQYLGRLQLYIVFFICHNPQVLTFNLNQSDYCWLWYFLSEIFNL